MSTAISVTDLVKTFGRTRALDGLTLSVDTGEVHGFLGPNGAGKSTTIRVLLGLLRRDSGSVQLLGGDPVRDAVALHRRLAYVPGDVNLWDLTRRQEAVLLDDRSYHGWVEAIAFDSSGKDVYISRPQSSAVEVVDFVLQTSGKQSLRLDLVRFEIEIDEPDLYGFRTLDFLVVLRN